METEFKGKFLCLFHAWATVQFTSVPNGGFLAATALDIAMNVDEETLINGMLVGKQPMRFVIDLGGFMVGVSTNDTAVIPIDAHDAKRWKDACSAFGYNMHDNNTQLQQTTVS